MIILIGKMQSFVVNLAVRVEPLRIKGLTAWYIKYEVSLSQSKAHVFKSHLLYRSYRPASTATPPEELLRI